MDEDYGCKVCRVLSDHGLEHYDERLLDEWRGSNGQRKGYRQLARWLNVTLLRREMDKVGLSTLGDEAESKYDRLQDEGATATEVASMLEREGIDIESLQSDFVSYGVVRTHLIDCLGAKYERPTATDWETDAISIARDHAEEKIMSAVQSLERKGDLDASDDVAVHVDVEIECEKCQTRVPLHRALRRGEVCNCEPVEVKQ
ncbi:rod-determining factor RdfA [Natrinema gelatinilyticum]|uniref:rod-determining factor RdfA n=1 Tax=Natrinema gelatinilyticum TaxID=2961571 RepID=UPI0020C521A4|nr:rod-determining factor RdfA [Natrinema gelatinilyticum]